MFGETVSLSDTRSRLSKIVGPGLW